MIYDAAQAVFIPPYGLDIDGTQIQALNIQLMQPCDYFGIRFYPGTFRFFLN